MAGRTFIFREEWLEVLQYLKKNQRDNVIRAAYSHAFELEMPELTQIEQVAFAPIKSAIDRDMEKFEARKQASRENGKKGGRPRTEKTQENLNNPAKPIGYQVNSQVSNPIPIPNSNSAIEGTIASSPSYNSSPSSGAEFEGVSEEDKERILCEFVFKKNLASPEEELREFLDFNHRDGRCWEKMSAERQRDSIKRWKQQPEQKPRFTPDFLNAWQQVYAVLVETDAPLDIRMDALSDTIAVKDESFVGYTHLQCPPSLSEYLERKDVLEKVIPIYKSYNGKMRTKGIKYAIPTTKNNDYHN